MVFNIIYDKPLCLLLNKSLRLKKYPRSWKIAHVIPLFKNGDKSLPSNYRPVSLLSCVSKIFEKIVYKNIFNHLHKNKLLYKFQSGFIPGLSTTHQLLEIYHTILTALDNKFFTSITFADVSKAFDRVWIGGLLLKLERYGIKGDLLMWLKSYLTNRSQKVAIKEALSELDDLKAGVPQGSVLGPLLFLVFINDIADDMLGLSRLFADDTSIGHRALDESNSIYREAGWEKLSTRREVKKLCMFYKLNVGNSPEFLCDLIPPSVGETNNYNLRNSYNISQTTNRLSISQQSFFPLTTKLWNLLDLRIRQLSTFESFKYKLKQHYYKNAKPPSYYNIGNRYLNILHTRI